VEKDVVTLAAADPLGTAAAPTVIGSPSPAVSYRFDKTGALAVPGLPACSATPTLTLPLPGVTADAAIAFTHDVWFETDCTAVGFLTTSAPPQPVTVRWNPPWTLTALTPAIVVPWAAPVSVLLFQVGGRPGSPADLEIEASGPAGMFPLLPKAVTPGPDPVDVLFTPPPLPGLSGTFVGRLAEPSTNRTLAQSETIWFVVTP